MDVRTLMRELLDLAPQRVTDTVDTLKYGDEFQQVTKVVTCFIATADVIRQAGEMGAQLIITHEPTFYDHLDHQDTNWEDPVIAGKRRLLAESGCALWRYHDHPHMAVPDIIYDGVMRAIGFKYDAEAAAEEGVATLKAPMTARQMASRIAAACGVEFVRVSGSADAPMTRILPFFGSPPPQAMMHRLGREDVEAVLTGESCEWMLNEYARDAAQMGMNKAVLVIGHEDSEHSGMENLARILRGMHPELEVVYLGSGTVYEHVGPEE